MDYIRLGETGLKVSRVCLGCMTYGVPEHHLDDAVAALSLNLTPEEVSSLEEPYVPHPVVGY